MSSTSTTILSYLISEYNLTKRTIAHEAKTSEDVLFLIKRLRILFIQNIYCLTSLSATEETQVWEIWRYLSFSLFFLSKLPMLKKDDKKLNDYFCSTFKAEIESIKTASSAKKEELQRFIRDCCIFSQYAPILTWAKEDIQLFNSISIEHPGKPLPYFKSKHLSRLKVPHSKISPEDSPKIDEILKNCDEIGLPLHVFVRRPVVFSSKLCLFAELILFTDEIPKLTNPDDIIMFFKASLLSSLAISWLFKGFPPSYSFIDAYCSSYRFNMIPLDNSMARNYSDIILHDIYFENIVIPSSKSIFDWVRDRFATTKVPKLQYLCLSIDFLSSSISTHSPNLLIMEYVFGPGLKELPSSSIEYFHHMSSCYDKDKDSSEKDKASSDRMDACRISLPSTSSVNFELFSCLSRMDSFLTSPFSCEDHARMDDLIMDIESKYAHPAHRDREDSEDCEDEANLLESLLKTIGDKSKTISTLESQIQTAQEAQDALKIDISTLREDSKTLEEEKTMVIEDKLRFEKMKKDRSQQLNHDLIEILTKDKMLGIQAKVVKHNRRVIAEITKEQEILKQNCEKQSRELKKKKKRNQELVQALRDAEEDAARIGKLSKKKREEHLKKIQNLKKQLDDMGLEIAKKQRELSKAKKESAAVVKKLSSVQEYFPSDWCIYTGMCLSDHLSKTPYCIPLDSSTHSLFQRAIDDSTSRHFKVISVERIENPALWSGYDKARKTILEINHELKTWFEKIRTRMDGTDLAQLLAKNSSSPSDILFDRKNLPSSSLDPKTGLACDYPKLSSDPFHNEKYLWYSSKDVSSLWKTGIDTRSIEVGTFGRGIHTFDVFHEADKSAPESSPGVYTVLLLRVLLGPAVYHQTSSSTQRRPPNHPKGNMIAASSVCGKLTGGENQYVVFETTSVYPQYYIKYSRGK
ncbi:hypothetical protein ADUPG1_008004 [Aduncisulcus paluster]|uniref:Poly [ADP-ribose] polymerase n=1 Tax=Aduncisulcus paluster TaxID=2918883 RepID=A0ABQ5KQE0_9EUKA|nr:hypothetical protein ADUPG1_008004 [Aduncisulcus paluster]